MTLPPRHLLVIGAQRCGTTYLQRCLDAHPEITTARPARPEPKVFLSEELSARGGEWYRETYFSHATSECVLAEKSTSYLEYAEAAERAAAALGTADIVVLLRDPVERAVSNWRFSTENGFETRPLEDALRQNLAGAKDWTPVATSVSPYAYLERGRYADYLPPWFTAFSGSVHVRFYEEMVGDGTVVADLYDVLGVDPGFSPPVLGRQVNRSEQPAPELDSALTARLRGWFADSDAMLGKLLDRELPWPAVSGSRWRGRGRHG